MGDGVARIRLVFGDDRLLKPIAGRTPEPGFDRTGHTWRRAPDQRQIGPAHISGATVVGELRRQCLVGAVVLSARTGRFGPSDEGSRPPGLEVGGEPAGRRVEKASGHGHHHMHDSHVGDEDAQHAEGNPEADGHNADGGESGRRPALRSDWSAGNRSMTSKTEATS